MKLKDQEKQERIRQATIDIVAEQGIAGVKMALVAKRAEMVPSALYVYYKNKEELLVSIFKDLVRGVAQRVTNYTSSNEPEPFRKVLWNMFEQGLRYKQAHYKEEIFVKMFVISPYFTQEMQQVKKELEIVAARIMELGKQQMVLKEDTPTVMLIAVLDGIVDKLAEYHFKGILTLDDAAVKKGFKLLWDSIKQ